MRCAIIDSNTDTVINVAIADPSWNPGDGLYLVALSENESCLIGQNYDENQNPRFSGNPTPTPKTYTAYQFLLRFTADERAAFRAAALTDPQVADFQQLAGAAQEISTDNEVTLAGLDYLVSINLLTENRKQEILG